MERKFKGGYATCDACQKMLHTSRKAARQHARALHPGMPRLNAYYCPIGKGWHLGNLPPGGRKQARRAMDAKIQKIRGEQ